MGVSIDACDRYQVRLGYRLFGLVMAGALTLFLPAMTAWIARTNPAALVTSGVLPWSIGLSIGMGLLGLLVYQTIAGAELVVSGHGIRYAELGFTIDAAWSEIERYGEVPVGVTPVRGLIVRASAVQVSDWLAILAALQPLLRVATAATGRPAARLDEAIATVIPVDRFVPDWTRGAFGAQIRAHAPHLLPLAPPAAPPEPVRYPPLLPPWVPPFALAAIAAALLAYAQHAALVGDVVTSGP